MNILIDDLEREFNPETEEKILVIVVNIIKINGLSSYQLSLALKRLADCYYSNAYNKKALAKYLLAIEKNPKLPIKRRIKELESSLH